MSNNNDRINERYYGKIESAASQQAAKARVHWMCKEVKGMNVLDIGCSQGITSILLGRKGFKVTGIDIEVNSLNYAKKELSKESQNIKDNVKFLLKDCTKMENEFGEFDSIVLGEVIEHFANPNNVVVSAYNVLKNNGTIIITVPFGYLPFHDHKCTYYLSNFISEIEPYFEEEKIEIVHKYICYVGKKRKYPLKNFSLNMIDSKRLLNMLALEEEYFLDVEQKNYSRTFAKNTLLNKRMEAIEKLENTIKRMKEENGTDKSK
jgi:cyclopropane fatty-acyl-phospholipid synthase-like methyltransferase